MTSTSVIRLFIAGIIVLITLVSVVIWNNRARQVEPPTQVSASDLYVELDGVNLRYRDEGNPQKPAMILMHGFSFSLESYDQLVVELKGDFRLIRFDFPGHGLTGPDPKKRYSHQGRVDNLHELITHLDLQKPILAGNSLGGITAWRYTAQYPDDVDKLILIDSGGFPMNGVTEKPVETPAMVASYLRKASKMAVTFGVRKLFADPKKIPEGRIEQIITMMHRPGNGDAMVEIIDTFILPDPEETLGSINTPTLILWGEQDSTIPIEHAAMFEKTMPNAELNMMENTGHTPQEEAPRQTAKLIRDFIKE